MPYKDKEKDRQWHKDWQRLKGRPNRIIKNECIRCGAPLIADESRYCFACMAGRHQLQIKGVLKYETAN